MRGKTIEFELKDMCALGLPSKKGKIEIADGGSGIFLTFDGYGTKCSDGHGPQVSIEYFRDKVHVLIWNDINREGMTHAIDLEGAREGLRIERAYYCYGNAEQGTIRATSLQAAAEKFGIPPPSVLADGGWLVVRDEETMETLEIGQRPK